MRSKSTFLNQWLFCTLLVWGVLVVGSAWAQSISTVSGRVSDETGQVLPGVTILLKGTTNGTTTNADGDYKLSVPGTNPTLVISYVGYQNQELPVNNQSVINVRLQPLAGVGSRDMAASGTLLTKMTNGCFNTKIIPD